MQKPGKTKYRTHTHSLSSPTIEPKLSANLAASPKLPGAKSRVRLSPKSISRKRSESLISIGFPRPSMDQEPTLSLGGNRMLRFDRLANDDGSVPVDVDGQDFNSIASRSVLAEVARIEKVFTGVKKLDGSP